MDLMNIDFDAVLQALGLGGGVSGGWAFWKLREVEKRMDLVETRLEKTEEDLDMLSDTTVDRLARLETQMKSIGTSISRIEDFLLNNHNKAQ